MATLVGVDSTLDDSDKGSIVDTFMDLVLEFVIELIIGFIVGVSMDFTMGPIPVLQWVLQGLLF